MNVDLLRPTSGTGREIIGILRRHKICEARRPMGPCVRIAMLLAMLAPACSGSHDAYDEASLGSLSCKHTSDCPPSPFATCAQPACSNGANPCAFVCRHARCVPRGCRSDVDGGDEDLTDATSAGPHAEGEACDDGLGCVEDLVCKAVGDPCPTFPDCRRCYLPCGPDGTCPSGYAICIPPYGQGGNVCIH